MKTIYLLPVDDRNVNYSKNKSDLEPFIINNSVCNQILETQIDDELYSKISVSLSFKQITEKIPDKYIQDRKKFLSKKPDWKIKEGSRIFIIFHTTKKCFWSPSGNNLNTIKSNYPDEFITDAIRVNLSEEIETTMDAYFEYMCDNF